MVGPLIDICENRHGGNTESKAAFDRIRESHAVMKERAFDFIRSRGDAGATAQEFADSLGVPINKISGRFTELKADGRIRKIAVRNKGGVYVEAGK